MSFPVPCTDSGDPRVWGSSRTSSPNPPYQQPPNPFAGSMRSGGFTTPSRAPSPYPFPGQPPNSFAGNLQPFGVMDTFRATSPAPTQASYFYGGLGLAQMPAPPGDYASPYTVEHFPPVPNQEQYLYSSYRPPPVAPVTTGLLDAAPQLMTHRHSDNMTRGVELKPISNHIPVVYLGAAIPDPAVSLSQKIGDIENRVPCYNPKWDYHSLLKAIAQSYVNERYLIEILVKVETLEMDVLKDYYRASQTEHNLNSTPLIDRMNNIMNGNLRLAARALILGPLAYDVELVQKAIKGMGTNEMVLIEVILGRPAQEIRYLKSAYKLRYGKNLVDDVKSDLSGSAKLLFGMALNEQKPPADASFDWDAVTHDVEALYIALKWRNGLKDDSPIFEIFINRSDLHIASIIANFGTKYQSLTKMIKKTFRGTVEQGLLYLIRGVNPKREKPGCWRDAKLIEKSMAGLGTKDQQLIYRIVRASWDRENMRGIKQAYLRRYGKTLEDRIKGDTSGSYRGLLVALVKKVESAL